MGGTGKVSLQLGEDGKILRCFLEPKKPAANDVLIMAMQLQEEFLTSI